MERDVIMEPIVHCPHCSSAHVIFSKKRNLHVCEDCGRELTVEKFFAPQRLFLSYGHDEHVSFALRLCDDLKGRGHEVWFDAERLQPGRDWEAFIEQGLEYLAADTENAAVLLLLTPHSVRRPDGYCLNEVARALSRRLRIIPLMVVESEPPLSICRIQWLDMRECLPIHEKEVFYKPRFERLLKAIEEHQLDFEGIQQRLLKTLQPLEFDAEILSHVPKFTGRRWVFDALDRWLREDPPRQRVFWISGEPGVGKTALSAVLSSRYLEVAALHLCKFGHAQKSDPRRVVSSIAYQLSTQLPAYEARLAALDLERQSQDEARTLFDNVLVQPLATLSHPPRPIVVLIDALDEATRNGRNELASFIAAEFPKVPAWVRLVVTSRPEKEVTGPLQGLNPFILDTETEANLSDLRDYLQRELAPLLHSREDEERIVEPILARSEGVFLYGERVCDDLRRGNLSLDRLEQFPQGLGGVFWQFFERQFPDQERFRKDIRPALRAILAAREGLPSEILQRLFDWKEDELHDFTRSLGSLFTVPKKGSAAIIKPYHKAVADWLTDEAKAGPYFVSINEGHRILATFCTSAWRSAEAFALSEAIYHIHATGNTEAAVHLLFDEAFLDAKVVKYGAAKLIDDIVLAEEHAHGRFGLAGAACGMLYAKVPGLRDAFHLPRDGDYQGFRSDSELRSDSERQHISRSKSDSERQRLFREACIVAEKWAHDRVSAHACAFFGIEALEALKGYRNNLARGVVAVLRAFLNGTAGTAELGQLRDTISPELIRAKNAPRVFNHISEENELSALDAALAFEPLRFIRCLWNSHIYSEAHALRDDPVGYIESELRWVHDGQWWSWSTLIQKTLKRDTFVVKRNDMP
jgi:TIR domain/AAA ATPase domain